MNMREHHTFWGSLSPLGGLTGAGLLIMGSARFSWAVTIAGCLFWVYGLTAFAFSFASTVGVKIFPKQGKHLVFTCMASFFGSVYLLLIWLLCPFAAFEVFMLLLLVPLFCAGSSVYQCITSPADSRADTFDHASEAISQAAVLAGLLLIFSILREPFAYCSLTFPGTYRGMMTIMSINAGTFLPINIFSSSSGALLMLGYFICLYKYGRSSK